MNIAALSYAKQSTPARAPVFSRSCRWACGASRHDVDPENASHTRIVRDHAGDDPRARAFPGALITPAWADDSARALRTRATMDARAAHMRADPGARPGPQPWTPRSAGAVAPQHGFVTRVLDRSQVVHDCDRVRSIALPKSGRRFRNNGDRDPLPLSGEDCVRWREPRQSAHGIQVFNSLPIVASDRQAHAARIAAIL